MRGRAKLVTVGQATKPFIDLHNVPAIRPPPLNKLRGSRLSITPFAAPRHFDDTAVSTRSTGRIFWWRFAGLDRQYVILWRHGEHADVVLGSRVTWRGRFPNAANNRQITSAFIHRRCPCCLTTGKKFKNISVLHRDVIYNRTVYTIHRPLGVRSVAVRLKICNTTRAAGRPNTCNDLLPGTISSAVRCVILCGEREC